MNKSKLITTITLGVASLLGLGAMIGVNAQDRNTVKAVKADESDYVVYISGVGQSSGSLLSPGATVNGNSGSVQYTRDSSTGDVTITFNNFKWSGNSICDTAGGNSVANMVYVQAKNHNVNVVVNGTNTINSTGADTTAPMNNLGIYFWASNVTFTGSGSLTYTAGANIKNANSGLYVSSVNKLTVDGPTLSFSGGTCGNSYDNGGDSYGAYLSGVKFYMLNGSFTAKGGTAVSGTGGAPADGVSYGFYNRYGSFYFQGGSFTAIGGTCGTGSDAMSVGLKIEAYSYSTIEVSKTIEKFTATASKNNDSKYLAILGPITTKPVAYSWTNKEGTGTPTEYAKDTYNNFAKSSSIRKFYAEGSKVEYTATNYSGTYDGNPHSATVTITEPSTGGEVWYYNESTKQYDKNEPAPTRTDAGTTTVKFKIVVEGYDPIEDTVKIIINKASSSVTTAPVLANACNFDGESHPVIATAGVASGGTLQYSVKGASESSWSAWSSSIPKKLEADTYTVKYYVAGDSNHNNTSEVTLGNFVINKANLTNVNVTVNGTYKYTGSPITPLVNAMASSVGGKAVTFTYSKTSGSGYGEMPSFTDAGTHTVYFKASAKSHNDYLGSFTFTINKKDAPSPLTDDQKPTAITTLVYSGSAQNLVNAPVSPLTVADGYTGIKYSVKSSSGTEWSEWSDTIPSEINAGYYDVRFYYVGDSNHADTEAVTVSNIHLDKAQSTISVTPTVVEGLKYTSEAQQLVVAGETPDGVMKYSLDGVTYSESIPTGITVGTYTVYYKVEGDSNHYDSEPQTLTIAIAENDKTLLVSKIDESNTFYNEILEDYPTIAGPLKTAIDAANAVKNNPNVTVQQIEDAINALDAALVHAQEDHNIVKDAVQKIKSIGEVKNTDSTKAKIEAAREAYDNVPENKKNLVDNYEVLVDDEHVYTALVKIDAIGDVTYDTDAEKRIQEAREYYDSLTENQKTQLGDAPLTKLVESESRFALLKHNANVLVLVLLIIVSLLVLGGLFIIFLLLKRKKKKDDDKENGKKKPVEAMSIGGLLPAVVLVSHYFDAPYIALYVLAVLAVLIWFTVLVLAILKKKKAGPFVNDESETAPVTSNATTSAEEEEEVETVTDEKGNIFQIRYIKSFTAKLIQSPDETKKYYEELKNEVLSYKNTKSRISWHFDSVNSGRNYVLRFAVRGKTLCVYFPLNADDYVDSKYKVEKAESKRYEDVPCLYRIKNDRRLGYAKELIAVVAERLGLEKGEEQHEVYSNLPYEPNKPLVARGLIKEQKVQVNKPATAPVVLETKTNSDGDEVVVTKDASGNIFEIRYIKSFTAKLSQSEDVTKDYYTVLKNYVLSYKGTHSRVSWHYDAINVGRDYVLKFAIRGKTLCVYYALDVSKVGEKYKVEEAKGRKFEDVPVLYRIKNDRRCEYAKELIDLLMSEKGLTKGEEQGEDYRIPTESTKALLAKGLIKEVKTKVQDKAVIERYESITVEKADEVMSDEKAEEAIEVDNEHSRREGAKAVINIDTLSENFNDGDEITLEKLIEKKLVPSKTGYVKVLARGVLDKKLTVDLNDYSLQAVKMIVLVGGHAKRIK